MFAAVDTSRMDHDAIKASNDSSNLARITSYRVAADAHVFTKWVTLRRRSAFSEGADVLHYVRGRVIEAEGEVSGEQDAPGLHVFRTGTPTPPEVLGSADHFMEIQVHVRSEDILNSGLDGRLRVRRLEVMT